MTLYQRLDLSLTVAAREPFAGCLARVFLPGPGEVVVTRHLRQLVARAQNKRIFRVEGWLVVTLPADWEIPRGQQTPFLLMLHSQGRKRMETLYCRCVGTARATTAGGTESSRLEFASLGRVLEVPSNVDPDALVPYELALVADPADVLTLASYQGWLWEKARKWERLRHVNDALRQLAGRRVT